MIGLTEVPTPFGELSEETQQALRDHWKSGGLIQVRIDGKWHPVRVPHWYGSLFYRARPEVITPLFIETAETMTVLEFRERFSVYESSPMIYEVPHGLWLKHTDDLYHFWRDSNFEDPE